MCRARIVLEPIHDLFWYTETKNIRYNKKKMRTRYPSDLTREQFEHIRPLLASVRKQTKPRTLDLCDVFNAVLYVLKTGCQWSALPHDYPKYKTVHSYFMQWNKQTTIHRKKQPSILELVLKKIRWRGSFVQWTQRENRHGHR